MQMFICIFLKNKEGPSLLHISLIRSKNNFKGLMSRIKLNEQHYC